MLLCAMNIYWLEQSAADVPEADNWLSAGERLRLSGMRFPKRRADWRLGRWTAKNAVAVYQGLSTQNHKLAEIEIQPAPSGAPEVFFDNTRADLTISLSHRNGSAACVIASKEVLLGCDLEIVEPHSDPFIADYFTCEEQALVACTENKDLVSALLWSAKESALKALQLGLRVDPRSVSVELSNPQPATGVPSVTATGVATRPQLSVWKALQVHHESGRVFNGWWQQSGKLLRTVVSDPASPAPILLFAAPRWERTAPRPDQESAVVSST